MTGCGLGGIEHIAGGYTCADPDVGFVDPATGIPDPCHERTPWPDAGDPNACKGECVQQGPNISGWNREPSLLWIGPKGQFPGCPERAPSLTPQGYTDAIAPPLACNDVCTCEPSTGLCGLAQDMKIRVHAAVCPATGATEISFDPPMSWDGSCTTANQVPAGMQCPGGVDCAQSMTLDPLVITTEQCAVGVIPPPSGAPVDFLTEAVLCDGTEEGDCPGADDKCLPLAPGFRHCVVAAGDCPTDGTTSFTEQYVFQKKGFDDRSCDCACGAPAGSMCTGCIGTYIDDTCSVMRSCYDITSAGPDCKNIMPPGAALLSKQAVNLTYNAGTCEPSGTVIGTIQGVEQAMLCCLPPGPPVP